ncbi:MAG: hypothetical protein ACOY94_01010 [Bacillota bacterium]
MWDVESLEAHWLACMASAGGGGQVTRLAGATVLANPVSPLTMLNCILLRNTPPGRLEALLEVGRVVLAARERPPALFLSPLSGDVAALEQRLTELGWRPALRQTVLVRPLDLVLPEPDPGLPAVTVTTDLERWGRLLAEAYEVPDPLSGGLRAAWTNLAGEARHYLAWLDDRPIGTGLAWRQGPIVGLYAGAVLPAYRRRGAERATLLRRLADGRRGGGLVATLQTEADSPVERLCRFQLSFRPAYERSLWLPSTPAKRLSPL